MIRIVFYHFSTVKRFVAVCGIALTLLSCLQQAHALCQLTGCKPQTTTQGRSCCCKCSARLASKCACAGIAEKPTSDRIATTCPHCSHGPSCPARGNCSCCQSIPTPNLISPLDVELATIASASCAYWASVVTGVDFLTGGCDTASAGLSAERSIETCVRLCRFLA